MTREFTITCSRAQADEVEAKLRELDPAVTIEVLGSPRLTGLVDALSLLASLSTIASSAFLAWVEVQKRLGRPIRIEEPPPSNTPPDTGEADGQDP